MVKIGPEHRLGWFAMSDDKGSKLEIFARHNTSQRFPRSGEFARNISRGLPANSMVEEVRHGWLVVRDGRRVGFMEQSPSGGFRIGALWTSRPGIGIVEAAKDVASRLVGPPREIPHPTDDTTEAHHGLPTP